MREIQIKDIELLNKTTQDIVKNMIKLYMFD